MVQIQISWLLQKPTDLDLHCLLGQGMSFFSKRRVNMSCSMDLKLGLKSACTSAQSAYFLLDILWSIKNTDHTVYRLLRMITCAHICRCVFSSCSPYVFHLLNPLCQVVSSTLTLWVGPFPVKGVSG